MATETAETADSWEESLVRHSVLQFKGLGILRASGSEGGHYRRSALPIQLKGSLLSKGLGILRARASECTIEVAGYDTAIQKVHSWAQSLSLYIQI